MGKVKTLLAKYCDICEAANHKNAKRCNNCGNGNFYTL